MEFRLQSGGQLVRLSPGEKLGSGGEGDVFALPNNSRLVAKVYKKPEKSHAAKLTEMLANPPVDPMASQGHVSIAWPVDLLYSIGTNAHVSGFVMPRIIGLRSISDYYNPRTRVREFPLFHYGYLMRTARNVAAAFRALHARGYVIGDVNESNILVADTSLVTLIDTDSFQVTDSASGFIYRCNFGKPEFTPPELQGCTFAQVNRTPDQDNFGLAILIFLLLMENTHPFDGVYLGNGEGLKTAARIKNGDFPYARSRLVPYRPRPIAPPFAALPPSLQELFRRCFEDGHISPATRPDAGTWQSALEAAESSLQVCGANGQHRFSGHQRDCVWCRRKAQFGGRDPFPSANSTSQGMLQKPLPGASSGTSAAHVFPASGVYPVHTPIYSTPAQTPTAKNRLPIPILVGALLVFAIIASLRNAVQHSQPSSYTPVAPVEPIATPYYALATPAPTGNCSSPNQADKHGMETAIYEFHRNVVSKNWQSAAWYENTSKYQDLATLEKGYKKTVESLPTIVSENGCSIFVSLRFEDSDGPQYCIDQRYDMQYALQPTPRWIIEDGHSTSQPRLCS